MPHRIRDAIDACAEAANEAELPYLAETLYEVRESTPETVMARAETVQRLLKVRPARNRQFIRAFQELQELLSEEDAE